MSPRRKPTAEVMHGPMAVTVEGGGRGGRRANVRLAVVLAIVAVGFYVGIILLQQS